MHDDQLIANLRERYDRDYADLLERAGIHTYRQFLSMLTDETLDEVERFHAFEAIQRLGRLIDKRRVVSPLLAALNSSNERVVCDAIRTLGYLRSRRAAPVLIKLLDDQLQSQAVRIAAALGLSSIADNRAYPVVKRIMFDATDNLEVRACTIEWLGYLAGVDEISNYVELLSDPEPDVRFWAAFGLADRYNDTSRARSKLDEIVAFDHAVPKHWNWHTDREAMYPLEIIYFQALNTNAPEEISYSWIQYLISPTAEYFTFATQLSQWKFDGHTDEMPTPPVMLRVDTLWLEGKLRERWPNIVLNVREPRPQAYLLDWLLTFDNRTLIGALHRDQYAVVLTGDEEDVHVFAAWYRSVIHAEQRLYLYEWADAGKELKPGIKAEEISRL